MAHFLNFALLLTFFAPLVLAAPTAPSNATLEARQVYYTCYPECYTAELCECEDK